MTERDLAKLEELAVAVERLEQPRADKIAAHEFGRRLVAAVTRRPDPKAIPTELGRVAADNPVVNAHLRTFWAGGYPGLVEALVGMVRDLADQNTRMANNEVRRMTGTAGRYVTLPDGFALTPADPPDNPNPWHNRFTPVKTAIGSPDAAAAMRAAWDRHHRAADQADTPVVVDGQA